MLNLVSYDKQPNRRRETRFIISLSSSKREMGKKFLVSGSNVSPFPLTTQGTLVARSFIIWVLLRMFGDPPRGLSRLLMFHGKRHGYMVTPLKRGKCPPSPPPGWQYSPWFTNNVSEGIYLVFHVFIDLPCPGSRNRSHRAMYGLPPITGDIGTHYSEGKHNMYLCEGVACHLLADDLFQEKSATTWRKEERSFWNGFLHLFGSMGKWYHIVGHCTGIG